MAKISIGSGHHNSTLLLNVDISKYSQMVLNVGDGHDMSSREITIIERDEPVLNVELTELNVLIKKLCENNNDPHIEQLCCEANIVASKAKKIVEERKWYSISLQGVIDAAKTVGDVASPLISTAINIIELLCKAKT